MRKRFIYILSTIVYFSIQILVTILNVNCHDNDIDLPELLEETIVYVDYFSHCTRKYI